MGKGGCEVVTSGLGPLLGTSFLLQWGGVPIRGVTCCAPDRGQEQLPQDTSGYILMEELTDWLTLGVRRKPA